MRDLGGSPRTLAAAAATLEARADRANALHARLIAVRRLLLLGRLDEAAAALAPARRARPAAVAARGGRAGRGRAGAALAAHGRGAGGARARRTRRPNARACRRCWPRWPRRAPRSIARPRGASRAGDEQPLRLDEVEALLASGALVVDACRRGLRAGAHVAAAGAPAGAVRAGARAGRGVARRRRSQHADRARLPHPPPRRDAPRAPARRDRPLARARRAAGAASRPPRAASCSRRTSARVVVLVPPIDGEQASLLALLADGAAWSTSALALALGASQRTVQRALVELEEARRGCARSGGRARSAGWRRRWPDSRRSCYSPLRCRSRRLRSMAPITAR